MSAYVPAQASPAQAGEAFRHLLLSCERQAVGALIDCRIALMSADDNLVQRAVVLQIAVMGTLADSTFNGLVCFAVHIFIPLCWITGLVCLNRLNKHLYFYSNYNKRRRIPASFLKFF